MSCIFITIIIIAILIFSYKILNPKDEILDSKKLKIKDKDIINMSYIPLNLKFPTPSKPYFLEIFLDDRNIETSKRLIKKLSDDEFIKYKQWENKNIENLYAKYFPNTQLIVGKCDHIIFHGMCLSCNSQYVYGINGCKGCKYFRFTSNSSKPNLFLSKT